MILLFKGALPEAQNTNTGSSFLDCFVSYVALYRAYQRSFGGSNFTEDGQRSSTVPPRSALLPLRLSVSCHCLYRRERLSSFWGDLFLRRRFPYFHVIKNFDGIIIHCNSRSHSACSCGCAGGLDSVAMGQAGAAGGQRRVHAHRELQPERRHPKPHFASTSSKPCR